MRPIELPPDPDPDPLCDPLSLATVAEVSERGYGGLTARDVAARAGVTMGEFHRRYVDLDHCVLDTYERLIAFFERRVAGAFNRHQDWRSALRAAAYESVDILEAHPSLPSFGLREVLRMESEMMRVRREELFLFCAQMIERGRETAPDPQTVPQGAAIMAVGSILQLFTHRLQERVEIDLHASTPEMIYSVVRTYRGEEAAREELFMPRPTPTPAIR